MDLLLSFYKIIGQQLTVLIVTQLSLNLDIFKVKYLFSVHISKSSCNIFTYTYLIIILNKIFKLKLLNLTLKKKNVCKLLWIDLKLTQPSLNPPPVLECVRMHIKGNS